MSLRAFWYAAEAFRVEEGVSFVTPGVERARPANVAAKNTEGMQKMMGLMGGVQKGRRR